MALVRIIAKRNAGTCPYCSRMMLKGHSLAKDFDSGQFVHTACLVAWLQEQSKKSQRPNG